MEEIGALDILCKNNPEMQIASLVVFADAVAEYQEASENIAKNGAVSLHPRTGAPIENPYIKIRRAAGEVLARMSNIDSSGVF